MEKSTIDLQFYPEHHVLLMNILSDDGNKSFTIQGKNASKISSAIKDANYDVKHSLEGISLTSSEQIIWIHLGDIEPLGASVKNDELDMSEYEVTGIARYYKFISKHEYSTTVSQMSNLEECVNGGPGSTGCETASVCWTTCGEGYYACCYYDRCICVCEDGNDDCQTDDDEG